MAFFIGIACPWLLIAVLDRIAEGRRSAELAVLGVVPPSAPAQSSYLTPARPYCPPRLGERGKPALRRS